MMNFCHIAMYVAIASYIFTLWILNGKHVWVAIHTYAPYKAKYICVTECIKLTVKAEYSY